MYLLNFKVGLWLSCADAMALGMKDWVDLSLPFSGDRTLMRLRYQTPGMEEFLLCGCFLLLAFILVPLDPEAAGGFSRLRGLVIRLGWKKDLQIVQNFGGFIKEKDTRVFPTWLIGLFTWHKWVHSINITFKQGQIKDKIETLQPENTACGLLGHDHNICCNLKVLPDFFW